MFSISNKTLHFLLHQSVRIKVAIHHVQTKKKTFPSNISTGVSVQMSNTVGQSSPRRQNSLRAHAILTEIFEKKQTNNGRRNRCIFLQHE